MKLWFDRLISGGSLKQIIMLLVASVCVFFVVGGFFVMFWQPNIGRVEGIENEPFWQLYYYFVDPGNQMSMNGSNDGSRLIGFIISTLGSIFLGGLLISTITNTMERRVDDYKKGNVYYKLNDHAVIIGSDQMLHGIINQLLDDKSLKYILVMTTADVEATRDDIITNLRIKKDQDRIIVNYGSRDSEEFLDKICVAKAKEVYVLGDDSEFDDIESYHDSLNVQCISLIAKLCKEAGRKGLQCNVAFDYKTTYHIFQYADLPADITEYIKFHPFNFCNFWAQKVLVTNISPDDGIEYKPLDYVPITSADSDNFVHFIIIGFSKMGQAMALQAAHIAHYPNYRKKKTRITVIDRNMLQEMDEFKLKCGELFEVSHSTYIDADRWVSEGKMHKEEFHINDKYKHLITDPEDKDFIDIEWTFIKGDDGNRCVRKLLDEYIEDKNAIITVAVCTNITHEALRSAMHLPMKYYERNIPILVQQRKTASIVDILNGKGVSMSERELLLYKNIKPFGMLYDSYDIRVVMCVDYCKRINAIYSGQNPENIDHVKADEAWDELKTSKRWSNIYCATSIPTKLRCIGYDTDQLRKGMLSISKLNEEQVNLLAEIEHNRWNVEELLLGYRPVTSDEDAIIDKDKSQKKSFRNRFIHYDIRPYDGLKEDASGKNASFYDKMIVSNLHVIVND